jgi:queuine tRNA-ribosyltransferase
MEMEQALGPDIAMVLDECPPPLDRAYNERSPAPTAGPSAAAPRTAGPTRRSLASCRAASSRICVCRAPLSCSELDFPGYAIGGLAVGETKEQMYATLDVTCPALPATSRAT